MVYSQYGAYHSCHEEAIIGPLSQSFFDASRIAEFIEFKIYNTKFSTISSLNKKEL